MMPLLKLLNPKNKPPAHLDDYLLRDLGVTRIDSEFASHAPLAFENVDNAKTFLDNWVAQNVPDNASPNKKLAGKLACRCVEDAKAKGISKAELEAAAGEEMTDCMMDAQLAGAESRIAELF